MNTIGSLELTPTGILLKPHPLIRPSDESVIQKDLGGKRVTRGWYFPKYICYIESLSRAFPEIDASNVEIQLFLEYPFHVPELSREHLNYYKLFPYQKEGVQILCDPLTKGELLALSPGLGKSAVATIASELLGYRNVLVVAPLSLLPTWEYEYMKWSENKIPPQTYRDSKEKIQHDRWVITNYDMVSRHSTNFQRLWDLIILDESVLIKNHQTLRFKRISRLAPLAKKVWCLSGSPITRAVDDLWTQFHTINPQAFKSYWRFADQYCVIEDTVWGKRVAGSKDLDFQKEFRDIMFVRNQKDVLDLPKTLYETIYIEMEESQNVMYQQALKEFEVQLSSGETLTIVNKVSQLTRLLQIVSNTGNIDAGWNHSGKTSALLELLDTGYIQSPTLIWVHWKEGAYLLFEELVRQRGSGVGIITGDTHEDRRTEILQAYKNGEIDILILSLSVGKYGLTLTNTQTTVYYDRTFSMDDYIQSLHRVDRIGLDHSPLVISLTAKNTVDELVEKNLAGKSIDIARITNADLLKLLRSLGRE